MVFNTVQCIFLIVVGGDVILSTDLAEGAVVEAANGDDLTVTSLDPPTINDASVVVTADIYARNGVIHVIDAVLIPPASSTAELEQVGNNGQPEELFPLGLCQGTFLHLCAFVVKGSEH
jgi:hypothetical protein